MIQTLPLKGRTIALTRNPEGAGRMAERLESLGAQTISLPLLDIREEIDKQAAVEILKEFASYEWMVFTSRNGVRHFLSLFLRTFGDIRSLGFIRIAAIGQGTVEALSEFHLKPDLVPQKATAESLATALAEERSLDNCKVLLITGNLNREDLAKKLWEERAIVDSLQVYGTYFRDLTDSPEAARFRKEGADALVFASGSAVEAFGRQAHNLALEKGATVPALCSFGPATSARMKEAGIPVAVEAGHPGLEGMVEALVHFFAARD